MSLMRFLRSRPRLGAAWSSRAKYVLAVGFAAVLVSYQPAQAGWTFKTLYAFAGGSDGEQPQAPLIDVGGTLYGTTAFGGSVCDCGTVFSLTTAGVENVIHTFGNAPDGNSVYAGLLNVGGELYGTAQYGGTSSCADDCGNGVVFAVPTSGGETLPYTFQGGSDGGLPAAGLIDVSGLLYGTTFVGGGSTTCYQGCGTVFSLTTGGKEKVVYAFTGSGDGIGPSARLLNVKGTLYGTTFGGTVFKITRTGHFKLVHLFTGGSDGAEPTSGLIDVKGTLYGTTNYGGGSANCNNGCGTVFQIAPDGTESVLYAFKGGKDGAMPRAALLDVKGTLYGTTMMGGGSANCSDGCGTVFEVNATGGEQVLHRFAGASDGAWPVASLTNVGGTLYGTVRTGENTTCGCGGVFTLTH